MPCGRAVGGVCHHHAGCGGVTLSADHSEKGGDGYQLRSGTNPISSPLPPAPEPAPPQLGDTKAVPPEVRSRNHRSPDKFNTHQWTPRVLPVLCVSLAQMVMLESSWVKLHCLSGGGAAAADGNSCAKKLIGAAAQRLCACASRG
jgi:hypothetical protein